MILFKTGITSTVKLKKYGEFYLRKNTSDLPIFRHVFLDHEYNLNIKFNDPKVIIDVGANIGMFTRFIQPLFPNSKIICIEPEPDNFETLKKNIDENSDVILIQKALWIDNKGVQIETDTKYGEWGASVSHSSETGHRASAITMNQLMHTYGLEQIDILKIDIEGAEKYIFQNDLSWMQKVKTLIIELHDFRDKGSSNNFFKALENMEPYEFFVSGENIVINKI